jgi:hypothetical protein
MGLFQTGGALGGGQYSSTGGAFGGGVVTRTGGSFGEGYVTQTGGSLGEAMAVQNSNVCYKLDKSLEYYLVPSRYPEYPDAAQSKYSPGATASSSTSTSSPPPHWPSEFSKFGGLPSHNRGGVTADGI